MINQVVVRIVAERIINEGINPKTNEVYQLDDVTNIEYRSSGRRLYINEYRRNLRFI
ncbi:hypothetical protein [Tissierella pigra]|uniref:hypothetical protein n=1 Tax=Tissierella pigra TaxID=2607614 RepID=UPI0018A6CC72|nr:hypothetical protein [Tissierella pigra]